VQKNHTGTKYIVSTINFCINYYQYKKLASEFVLRKKCRKSWV